MYGVQKLFGALQPQCNLLQNKCDPKLIWKDSIYTLNEQWATSDVLHANAFSLVAKWCKIVFYKVSQQDYTGQAVLSHFIFISVFLSFKNKSPSPSVVKGNATKLAPTFHLHWCE